MNTGFYKDLDTNFEEALNMANKNFSHDELIYLLKNGNIPEKQIAALMLDNILNQEEANILVANLTGCDGKIREATAYKINSLLIEKSLNISYFSQAETFADATIDINGNICRLIIDSVSILKQNKKFADLYINKILLFTNEAFNELDKFIFRDKKYVINKQLFKLYWCLEAIKLFSENIPQETLLEILKRAAEEKEYTIREKVAQIITKQDSEAFLSIKNTLINDENYYVKKALNH